MQGVAERRRKESKDTFLVSGHGFGYYIVKTKRVPKKRPILSHIVQLAFTIFRYHLKELYFAAFCTFYL